MVTTAVVMRQLSVLSTVPNEDVQLSIGSTVGGDETVFNAGLSVKVRRS